MSSFYVSLSLTTTAATREFAVIMPVNGRLRTACGSAAGGRDHFTAAERALRMTYPYHCFMLSLQDDDA